jgi:hypothetical protein
MNSSNSSRSLWPYAIIGWFVVAIIATVMWVTFAMRQRVDLVGKDYYEQEMRFQQQIDRLARTKPMEVEVHASYDAAQRAIVVTLPAGHARQPLTGSIQLYRPSDANLDRNVPLAVDASGTQRLDARQLLAGLWKVKVKWNFSGQEYFFDQPVVVAGL